MVLRYYNPARSYSKEELVTISNRLESEIAGCRKFQKEFKNRSVELDDALNLFLEVAAQAKQSIELRV